MNTKKKNTGAKVTKLRIHNPPLPLGLPDQKRRNMAAKKKNVKKSSGAKRKANPKASAASAYRKVGTKSTAAKKANPRAKKHAHKKHHHKRRNPISFAGLKPKDLAVGAGALIVSQAISAALPINPQSWLGIGVQFGIAALGYNFVPRSIGPEAVVLGAGITPMVNLINRLTNGVIGSTITNTLRNFIPQGQLPAANGGTGAGMAGFPRVATSYR